LPLKIDTLVAAEMPVTGSRIVLRGSEEVGMCHELPMEFTTTLFVTGYGFQKYCQIRSD